MTQEIDLESVLRSHLRAAPEEPLPVTVWLHNENRIVAKIGDAADAPEFLVFGNNVRQYPIPKPPTQRAAVAGFDAFQPMGAR